jgi:ClpP class serine protease
MIIINLIKTTNRRVTLSVLKTLARRYLDVPQLITPQAFKEVAELLDLRQGRDALESYFKPLTADNRIKAKMADPFYSGYKFSDDGSTESEPAEYGVIKVEGALTYKPEMSMCAPDTCNYQEIVKQMEHFASVGKKRVLMIHDSCGGEAMGMFSTAKELRNIADEKGIELIGYVDGMAASASYGLLSVCDKIIAHPDASVGSIGVVISLVNNSEAIKNAGYKRVFITAGENKVPFDEEGDFKESFLTGLQEDVDALYDKFVNHVSTFRSIPSENVIATNAEVFRTEEALELGLIDEVMDVSEFKKKYLVGEQLASPSKVSNTNKDKQMSQENLVVEMAEVEALKAELATLKQEKLAAQLKAKTDAITAQLSGAEFLTNLEGVVSFMVGAEDAQAALINGIISDAQAKLVAQKEEATLALSELTAQYEEKLAAAAELHASLEADKESVIEEFAKPQATRKVEKEENTQELTFEQKLARSVELAKSKANL